jgi:hypothetical protein
MTPVAMARLGAKQKPARKRRIHNPAKVFANPTPTQNKAARGVLIIYTGYRPTVSDNGPPTTGPSPKAKTYRVRFAIASVLVTPNSCTICSTPGEVIDDPSELYRIRCQNPSLETT